MVGASAGGVEALSPLVAHLPADLPAAVFMVLHVPPGVRFRLPEILSRRGPLPVRQARSPEQLRTYVGRLRRKLELAGAGCRLENVRGTGYRLVFN